MEHVRTLPPILISRPDYERLAALVGSRGSSASWPGLVDELSRADIVDAGDIPGTIVTMGAAVDYIDNSTGSRRVTLVFPGQEDISAGKISVLTPIGTALIGLSKGDSMEWQTRAGELKRLTVARVVPAPTADNARG